VAAQDQLGLCKLCSVWPFRTQMWRDCGDWMTDEFRGYPEFSHKTFAHVYEHATDGLLVWIRDSGTGTGVRWMYDLGRYVRHRSKAEGRWASTLQVV